MELSWSTAANTGVYRLVGRDLGRYGALDAQFGYVQARLRDRTFTRALAIEVNRIRTFLPNHRM
jgi:hypothetical protein